MSWRTVACTWFAAVWAAVAQAELVVEPASVAIDRPESLPQVVVLQRTPQGLRDVTRNVQWTLTQPDLAEVSSAGVIRPLHDGAATLTATIDGESISLPLTIQGLSNPPPISFEHEIQPVLTKARCNSGGCHGKAEGQNGFKLSLLGFDNDFDHAALTLEARGRRINTAAPDKSLLLLKGTATVPHGGGRKLDPGAPSTARLLRWIAAGALAHLPNEQPIVGIEVSPPDLVLQPKWTHQLRVIAIDAAGRRQCVTVESDYISNAPHVVDVSQRGLLEASDVPGESAILVRYLGHVAVCRVTVPRSGSQFARPPENNFIDQHVWNKLTRLGIPPSDVVDDAAFLRRVSLDTIGTLPTADEARRFLADSRPDKRARLVDELLDRPEYADYWAMRWSDLLRADKIKVTPQGAVGLTRWLRRQFTENRPFDQMTAEILTAQGPVQAESPAAFFKSLEQPEVASRSVSQLFLGVRIECAQCHHHPSERWSQDDYAGLVGFFSGLSIKKLPDGTDAVISRGGTDTKHPRTGDPVPAKALGAPANADFTGLSDRRVVLAKWMTDPQNPWFARAIANRIWAHYLGRGLVMPIDDFRATNPATNEPLLDALAQHLRDVRYDLKAFTRTILTSRVYQLSSKTLPDNATDLQNFSHAIPKAMAAEVLLDALCQVTDVPEKLNGWPEGVRAIQVWDNRMPSYFFRVFGRPVRATVCECERSNEPSITQALHLMNSPEVHDKLTHRRGAAHQLADSTHTPDELLDDLFLRTLTRYPTDAERTLLKESFTQQDRRTAAEDILWTLLNSKEFLYVQ
jgi:hypothetical protein